MRVGVRVGLAATVVAIVVLWSSSAGAMGQSGELDPTFGDGGSVDLGFRSVSQYDPITVGLSDGSVVTRTEATVGVARVTADGRLDRDFEAHLVSSLDGSTIMSVAAHPDGGLVALVRRTGVVDGPWPVVDELLRVRADGSVVATFGTAGRSQPVWPGVGGSAVNVDATGRAMFVQQVPRSKPDGSSSETCAVHRFLADGALDPSFGVGGSIDVPRTYPAGRGPYCTKLISGPAGTTLILDETVGITRLLSNGSVDPAWNSGAPAFPLPFGTSDITMTDRGLVAVGWTWEGNVGQRVAVARLTDAGVLDPSFGTAGTAVVGFADLIPDVFTSPPFRDIGRGIAALPDGGVLATGRGIDGAVVIAKLSAVGVLDPTFGSGGRAVVRREPGEWIGANAGKPVWTNGRLYFRVAGRLAAISAPSSGPTPVVPEGAPVALAVLGALSAGLVVRRQTIQRRSRHSTQPAV